MENLNNGESKSFISHIKNLIFVQNDNSSDNLT